ncbi:MAG TPA: hypothetical protein VGE04_07010 [Chloroflexia bacterium]
MTRPISDKDRAIWERLVQSHMAWVSAQQQFLSEGVDRVSLLQAALEVGDTATAFLVADLMSTSEHQELFRQWLEWAATSHGYTHVAREIIKSLPRDWVLARIEAESASILRNGTYDEYRRLLELYADLDVGLTAKLARKALEHADEEIREAGEDFLSKPDPA